MLLCVCVCVRGEHNQNCHCPEDSGLILPLSCVVMSSRYATWPLWFWALSPSPCPMPVWLALLPPLPPHPASRVSSAHGHSCRPSSPCLPRWTFNAVGEFGMDTKNHRPLTVPRGSLRRRQERAKEEKKKRTKGQSGCMQIRWREQTHTAAPHTKVTLCFHCTRRPKVTINIHCCRWVGLCRKAHWTMSATVAQICLTRVSANQSAGCEALWLFYLYTSCFSLLFSPSFLPPWCWES